VIKSRNLGFNLKKEGRLEEAKATLTMPAEAGDPLSQYELAQLLGREDSRFEALLKCASENLVQAKSSLYEFYLQKGQYRKAYKKLQDCVSYTLHCNIEFKMEYFPVFPKNCRVYSYEASEECFRDEFGQLQFIKRPDLPSALYAHAISSQSKDKKFHFYNLAATTGHSQSIVALMDYSKDKFK
jgi:hypothetical protein